MPYVRVVLMLSEWVDFFWEVNGKTYEFSLPGGGYVSFSDLVEILGVANQNQNEADDNSDSENSTENPEMEYSELTMGNVTLSEDTRNFVADVKNITFSTPSLLSVSKAEEKTTVGAIKDRLGLECEYSAELTEEQIEDINSTVVESGDWALISLLPFTSTESLTVTMKTGEVFEIRVTDAQVTTLGNISDSVDYILYVEKGGKYYALYPHTDGGGVEAVEVSVPSDADLNSALDTLDEGYLWRFANKTDNTYRKLRVSRNSDYTLRLYNEVGVYTNDNTFKGITKAQNSNGFVIEGWIERSSNSRVYQKLYLNDNLEFTYDYDYYTPINVYQQREHVTVHFVDRDGTPLSGVVYSGSNGQVVKNNDEGATIGTFTIPYEGNTSNIDLSTEFSLSGYTYASTHIAGTFGNELLTHQGVVIEPGLITKNNNTSLVYFTRTNREHTYYDTEEKTLGSVLQVYIPGNPNSDINKAPNPSDYTASGNQDIYVILDPIPTGYYSGNDGSTMDPLDVPDPEFNKILEPNGDGTYTLSLSVTGHASSAVLNPKANVLLIVDTSSSMDTADAGTEKAKRITKTREAVTVLSNELLNNNSVTGKASDTIEMAMVTFDGDAVTKQEWTSDKTTFVGKVDTALRGSNEGNGYTNQLHKGTNWEDALDYAFNIAKTKQDAQKDEPIYVIFFTDGEPSQYRYLHRADSPNTNNAYVYLNAYLNRETSKDEARAIVNAGMHLYGVYAFNADTHTYGPSYDNNWNDVTIDNEDGNTLLHNLIKYAYNTSSNLNNKYYYSATNPDELSAAFNNIIKSISQYIGVNEVVMNDGITSLTSVGITVINGTYTGFKYTISDGTGEQTWAEAPPATYDQTGVHWNLGTTALEDGKTYKVSFVVWPSQDAYDWVADLNNDIRHWSDVETAKLQDHFIKIEDSSKPSGYRYEVATNPKSYDDEGKIKNNLITYTKTHTETLKSLPNGVHLYTEVVDEKTGTKTTTTYTRNNDGTYTKTVVKKAKTAFGPPDKNMNLLDTAFKIQKKWVVDRPEELVYYLFNTYTGKINKNNKNIDFLIKQQNLVESVEVLKDYTTVKLGWISGEDNTDAVFDWVGGTQTLELYGRSYEIGSVWEEPLDIAVGLMLTPEKAAERGIDTRDHKYIPVFAKNDTSRQHILYYVLETGHDYTIAEPALDYRFDFHADVYHPMLDDGVLKDVKIDYEVKSDYDDNGSRKIGVLKYITPEGQKLSALSGENILRGELTLKKIVLSEDGEVDTSTAAKSRIFPITVTLENSSAPFYNGDGSAEQNVPWYGVKINGEGSTLYYHKLDEHEEFSHYCTESEACFGGTYDVNGINTAAGYQGNIMTETADHKTAAATLYVSPQDIWTITNIPGNSTYKITESQIPGYVFVKAEETGTTNVVIPPENSNVQNPTITGTVLANHTTSVEFTNKKRYTPIQIEVIKVDVNNLNDENPKTLPGATFTLEKYTSLSTLSKDTSWGTDGTGTITIADTERTGRFVFNDLPEGYYKIVEKVFPDGYIKTEETPVIEIRMNYETGKLQTYLLKKGEDNTYTDASENTDGTVRVENTIEKSTLTVGNTPGAVLPHTGGPGTRIFMVLGGLFLGLGGLLFMKRQRLI